MEIELYEALISANLSPDKARAVTDALRREIEGTLATKADLRALGTDLRIEMATLRGEMRTELRDLRADMHAGFAAQSKWLVGSALAAAGLLLAGMKLIH